MDRLLSVGAPITYEGDNKVYQESPAPKRLTRGFFRNTAKEALAGGATTPPRLFARWFVREYGYANSSAEFVRKFPWATRVVREVNKGIRDEQRRIAQLKERTN
jgi:hypothetical protein